MGSFTLEKVLNIILQNRFRKYDRLRRIPAKLTDLYLPRFVFIIAKLAYSSGGSNVKFFD